MGQIDFFPGIDFTCLNHKVPQGFAPLQITFHISNCTLTSTFAVIFTLSMLSFVFVGFGCSLLFKLTWFPMLHTKLAKAFFWYLPHSDQWYTLSHQLILALLNRPPFNPLCHTLPSVSTDALSQFIQESWHSLFYVSMFIPLIFYTALFPTTVHIYFRDIILHLTSPPPFKINTDTFHLCLLTRLCFSLSKSPYLTFHLLPLAVALIFICLLMDSLFPLLRSTHLVNAVNMFAFIEHCGQCSWSC